MQGNGSRFGEDRGLREGKSGRLFQDFCIVISKNGWSFFDRAGDSGGVFEGGWFGRKGFLLRSVWFAICLWQSLMYPKGVC